MTAFSKMARSHQKDAALIATSCSTIVESRRLLASTWRERVNGRDDALLTRSRASIADSKRLLAGLEITTATQSGEARCGPPATPTAADAETDWNPAVLSIHVFRNGARFSWTVCGPSDQILGRGMAENELKARADAFCAGMIYLDWARGRSLPRTTNLH